MSIVEVVAIIVFSTIGAIKGTGNYSGPDSKGLYLNLYAGSSFDSGVSSDSSKIVHGGSVGYFFNKNIEFGIESLTTKSDNFNQINKSLQWSYTETPVLLKFQYHTSSFLPGVYLGVLGGFSTRELAYESMSGDPFKDSTLTYGARVGYELFAYKSMSVGLSGTYLHLDRASQTYLYSDGMSEVSIMKADYFLAMTEFNYFF